jgi:hypothetical protein
VEPGFRAMLVHAPGLFRLDVVLTGDTLRMIVRNLSPGELETRSAGGGYPGEHVVFGEGAAYEPSHAAIEFSLGQGDDRVSVKADLATLRLADRGKVRITAQAIIRAAPFPR